MASNLGYTIWAVWGGFILHFLLSNYLSILLRPSYEKPVETAADLIERDIIPFYDPGGDLLKQFFETSTDPIYQEISRRLVLAKDWDDFDDMNLKVIPTGKFAAIGNYPRYIPEKEYKNWYRSSETLKGDSPFSGHLENKKWPLKKVFCY